MSINTAPDELIKSTRDRFKPRLILRSSPESRDSSSLWRSYLLTILLRQSAPHVSSFSSRSLRTKTRKFASRPSWSTSLSFSLSLFHSFSSHRRRGTSRLSIPRPERIKQSTGISQVNMPRSPTSSARPPHRSGQPGFHNFQVVARAAPISYQSFVDAVNDLVQKWGPAKEYQPGPWLPREFGDNLKARLDEYTWSNLPAPHRKLVLKMLRSPLAVPNLYSRDFVSSHRSKSPTTCRSYDD